MARTPTQTTAPAELMPADQQAEQQLVTLQDNTIVQHEAELNQLAHSLGYQGSLTVGGLEDEIRFYQRRSVEALLECGKRLVLLKKITAHGEFEDRVEMLGFSVRTARRFMQAAAKITKSANLAVLSTQVKSASAFLELVTHDDDADLERLAELDDIDRMSASQLRDALREIKEEAKAKDRVLADNATKINEQDVEIELLKNAPFVPREGSAARTRQEQALLDEVFRTSLRLAPRMQKLLLAADAAMGGQAPEAVQHAARAAVQFVAQQLADMARELNIALDLDGRVEAPWTEADAAALATLEARNAAAEQ